MLRRNFNRLALISPLTAVGAFLGLRPRKAGAKSKSKSKSLTPDELIVLECQFASLIWFQAWAARDHCIAYGQPEKPIPHHTNFITDLRRRILDAAKWWKARRELDIKSNGFRIFIQQVTWKWYLKQRRDPDATIKRLA